MKNDHDLIHEFQSGNDSAFDELVQRHLQMVFGFFVKITQDKMAAEDLAQDLFIKLYRYLKKFRFESAFTTYLYRAQLNTINSWLRRNKWRNFLHLDDIPETGRSDDTVEDQWRKKELWDGIYQLPKKQRTVVMMRITEELSYQEIGKIMHISEGSAKVNFHHALNKLKEIIHE
ncbi:MAG: sigma-70 family RNA polymerase sigma factor [Candidatus Marinimicrobia bacterium]|jgi:RNA polymerase sigma-70 factor (ECF subfamily)|nr:sigma-70 family RNA polymerase sigma factor [Candidatus Neomarinimicrobiota bacterium]MBT3495937.1 sigma-70 family RNA polymerase sigma factor [Candidatus Neomarinimicrobiota bacterium]MBT3692105.1 sigma-70 family RNA polymerase sigma factor [Candidatus Neomarinimicrobiota bacterium]MBT3732106.1 sigma-70 family RNA polymerase sigma factor [Candidatus Neomarinimicrobiota bacterium]MBT4143827.1 sigma-70 family RNA polymerase sigma factor [Candidatus Neomarinimicrobiota bacterium]